MDVAAFGIGVHALSARGSQTGWLAGRQRRFGGGGFPKARPLGRF